MWFKVFVAYKEDERNFCTREVVRAESREEAKKIAAQKVIDRMYGDVEIEWKFCRTYIMKKM